MCMCGFCTMWVCLCGHIFDNCVVDLVISVLVFTVFCVVFVGYCVLVIRVLVLFVLCLFIVSFMYIYSYLFCLYWCKDYCHRVTTELQ
jgi:hypothetical protein